jgi:hypothetical protein
VAWPRATCDQRRLPDAITCLSEFQELFVALQRLLRQVRLRTRLQDGQVLLLDAGDEHVLRPGDIGIGGALLGFRESGLGQRGA